MSYKYPILVLIVMIASSCNKLPANKIQGAEANTIPADTMHLWGTWYINDTIEEIIAFDSGAYGISMGVNKKKQLNIGDSIKLSQGNFSYTYAKSAITTHKDGLAPSILVGWKILEDKIIELSTGKGMLWTIQNTSNLEDFECINYTMSKGSREKFEGAHVKIIIPITVYIQGKEQVCKLRFDTGLSGSLMICEDTAIDLDYTNSTQSIAQSAYAKGINIKTLETDSLKIGNLKVGKSEVHIVDFMKSIIEEGKIISNGIVGTEILDNFRIVIDFPNQKMYFKHIDI